MPDSDSSPDVETQDSTTKSPQGDGDGNPEPQGSADTDWQAEARKWQKRAEKDGAARTALEQRVKNLISPEAVADKDRALAEAQAEATRAKLDVMRYRVAAEAGLALDMAPRLIGDDEDALREDAKRFAASLAPKQPRRTDAARGTTDDGTPQRRDPNVLLRQIVGGA